MPASLTDRLYGLTSAVAVKAPVRLASTGNLSLSSTQTIDGVAASTGDRVLVWNQSNSTENGIYEVRSGAWARTADFDGALDCVRGTLVYVTTGTAYADAFFQVTSTGINVPDSSAIAFGVAVPPISTASFPFLGATSTGAMRHEMGLAGAFISTTTGLTTASTGLANASTQGLAILASSSTSDARSLLGLAGGLISSATALTTVSTALVSALVTTATGTVTVSTALANASSFGLSLLDDSTAAAARITLGAAPLGCVHMVRTANSVNDTSVSAAWKIYAPGATDPLSWQEVAATSTAHEGLRSAMLYAARYGYDLKVWGGGVATTSTAGGSTGQDVAIINCVEGLGKLPPLQGVHWQIHATLNFGANNSSSTAAVSFDSVMASQIEMYGQVVVSTNYEVGVQFKPENELPQDPAGPVITSSRFLIPSVVINSTNTIRTAIEFNTSQGAISSNFFDFIEPNGGAIGVRIAPMSSSFLFDHNNIRIIDCHGQPTSINAGSITSNSTNIFGNVWEVQCDPSDGGVGIEIWGRNDSWIASVTNLEGAPTNGITLNAPARDNIITVLRNDATTKINDAATVKSNKIIAPDEIVEAHRGGTDSTSFASGAFALVDFPTETIDTLGSFNSSRTFTAQYPGAYLISARIGWVAMTDQTLMGTRISINSSAAVYDDYTFGSGTSGSQGADISRVVRLAAADTVQILARQDSGSTQSVSGSTAVTWLSIARL